MSQLSTDDDQTLRSSVRLPQPETDSDSVVEPEMSAVADTRIRHEEEKRKKHKKKRLVLVEPVFFCSLESRILA